MPEKKAAKKAVKFPSGARTELEDPRIPEWHNESNEDWWKVQASSLAKKLASAEWHSYISRPRGESQGIFVIMRWYPKEKQWVPIYMQQGNVASQLMRLFGNKDTKKPIGKYLSSFPHAQRPMLWVKWVLYSQLKSEENYLRNVPFQDLIQIFSHMYNEGEKLAFNKEEEQLDDRVPDNFSLLDCR